MRDFQETDQPGSNRTEQYAGIILETDKDPYSPEVLRKVLDLARSEEGTERANRGFYGHIPLVEMIGATERIRTAATPEDRYKILAEECSTGELWYDVVLGRTNDQSLFALGEDIGNWKNIMGSKVGERRWRRGLDIGSGTGNSLLEIKKHAEDFVGLDRLLFLLQVASLRPGLSGTKLVAGDALNLPFANEKFDLVMSNGLTYYLPTKELTKFAREVARVVEPGGSYFEAFPLKEKTEVVPKVEGEFLRSGKAVLACLMDRMLTHKDENAEGESWSFSSFKFAFKKSGFYCKETLHKDKGVVVLEFRKQSPPRFEHLRKMYLLGDVHTLRMTQEAENLIYGEAYVSSITEAIKSDKFSQSAELLKTLCYYGKLGQDQEVIEMNSLREYMQIFVFPIVDLAINDSVGKEIKTEAIKIIEGNFRRRLSGERHLRPEEVRMMKSLRKDFEDKPGCEGILDNINKVVSSAF